jgi:hypothetical protein
MTSQGGDGSSDGIAVLEAVDKRKEDELDKPLPPHPTPDSRYFPVLLLLVRRLAWMTVCC